MMPLSPSNSTPRKQAACDTCRSRKVKCTTPQDAIACEGCKFLGVECTREKPRRKRGPPNRHAQRLRQDVVTPVNESDETRQTLSAIENPGNLLNCETLSPTSTHRGCHQVPTFTCGSEILAQLGPETLITKILDDWFSYLHPSNPILHKRRCMSRLRAGEANSNPVFLALLISTCAATIASLRQKAFRDYRNITVEKCLKIIKENGLLEPDIYSLDWCIAQYNISSALMTNSKLSDMRFFRSLKNATTGVQWLTGYGPAPESLHDQEILKRLYGLLIVWQSGADTRGQPYIVFHPFHVSFDPLRATDLTDNELDGDSSLSNNDEAYTEENVRYIPGFNANVDIFLAWQSARLDAVHKSPNEVLQRGFNRIQAILDNLPPELRWRGGLSRVPGTTWGHEVQAFNLLVNNLYMKSSLLQHVGKTTSNYSHKVIISDLLEIFDRTPRSVLDASGFSMALKMRDIGAAYLEELRNVSNGQVVDSTADPQLKSLLERLAVLDATKEAERDSESN